MRYEEDFSDDDYLDHLDAQDAYYDDGYQAFDDGVPFDRCDYSGQCREAWEAGWLAAEEEERQMLREAEEDDDYRKAA